MFTTRFIGTPRGAPLEGKDRTDGAGAALDTTKKYSPEIGRTFAEVKGTNATYQLTGEELYVRAVVTSSLAHPDPSLAGQLHQAWTQPVGWSLKTDATPGE